MYVEYVMCRYEGMKYVLHTDDEPEACGIMPHCTLPYAGVGKDSVSVLEICIT